MVLRLAEAAEAFFAVSLWQRVVVMGKRKGKVRFVGPTAYGPGEWANRCNDHSYYRASCVRLPPCQLREVAIVLSLLRRMVVCDGRFRRMSLGIFSCLLSVVVLLLLLRVYTGNTVAVKVSAGCLRVCTSAFAPLTLFPEIHAYLAHWTPSTSLSIYTHSKCIEKVLRFAFSRACSNLHR